MTTFINGKPGIIDLIVARRNSVARLLTMDDNLPKLSGKLSKTRRIQMQAEIGAFNTLIAYLNRDDCVLLSETEYRKLASISNLQPKTGRVVTVEYRINPTEYLGEPGAEALIGIEKEEHIPLCEDTDDSALNLVHRGIRFGDVDLPTPSRITCGSLVLDPLKGYVR